MSSPLAGLMASAPKRRRSRSSLLGRILGTAGVLAALMIAMGFGVQQQAQHQIVTPTAHTAQHG
jgi:hypothetical protein